MIITIRTLQQKSFKVELDEAETVAVMKQKIEEEQGAAFPAAGIRLIYAGKILADTSLISEYKILESNFVVIIANKTKNVPPAPKPASTSASTPATTTPQESSTGGTSEAQPQATTDTPPTPAPTPTSAVPPPSSEHTSSEAERGPDSTDRGADEASGEGWPQVSNVLTSEPAIESAISNLMELGYEREMVVRAMQASYNDPNRAAQYLDSGIPSQSEERMQGTSPPQQPADPVSQEEAELQPQAANPASPPAAGANPLEVLRNQPQFDQLRDTLRQNPNMLQSLLQRIGENNPRLLSVISENQQAFIQMLNETPSEQESSMPPAVPPVGGGAFGNPVSIQVTQDEKEIIDRLKNMGFPEHLVIQAFFACEKNEELTVNFLLSQDPSDD